MIMSQDSHTQSPISQIGDMLDDGLILTDLDGVILSVNPAASWQPVDHQHAWRNNKIFG